ncbi:SPFH domain-containing protein [Streptomyces sp. NPDC002537]
MQDSDTITAESTPPEGIPAVQKPRVREFPAHDINGVTALLLGLWGLLLAAGAITLAVTFGHGGRSGLCVAFVVVGILIGICSLTAMSGLNTIAPGETRVVQLFGRYRGTIRTEGLRWVNPLTSRDRVSTRVRNHETAVLKVNDAYGNPIELAAVVVWRVEDTAQAMFEVEDFQEFVATQTEAAVRHIAIEYPYDAHDENALSLRGNAEEITEKLAVELRVRVEAAGVQIIESRFTHLAYAPEIASAMLQRQQAGAVVAARKLIVQGAVGMVEDAIAHINEQGFVELDDDRKAAMVSNLMVVLCGDRAAQPVLNTGTLYQ